MSGMEIRGVDLAYYDLIEMAVKVLPFHVKHAIVISYLIL